MFLIFIYMNKYSNNVELFLFFQGEATRYEFGFKFKCSIRLNHGTKLLLLSHLYGESFYRILYSFNRFI